MLLKRMEERSEYSQVYMYLENVSLVACGGIVFSARWNEEFLYRTSHKYV
jgi:hypothetical protein